MNINIVTFNLAPVEAYIDSDTAYKRYQTLKENKCIIGGYGIISLPIQDASQPSGAKKKVGHYMKSSN